MKKRKKRNKVKKIDSSNSIVKKKRYYNLIKGWFTWQKVGVILTGLGVFASVYVGIRYNNISQKTPTELLKDSIKSNIQIIQSDFRPEKAFWGLDTLTDIKMIRNYQKLVLELVTYWEEIESTPSSQAFITKEIKQLKNILNDRFERERNYHKTINSVFLQIAELKDYGVINKVDKYIPNQSKIINLNSLLEKKKNVINEAKNECYFIFQKMKRNGSSSNGIHEDLELPPKSKESKTANINDIIIIIDSNNVKNVEDVEKNKNDLMKLEYSSSELEDDEELILSDYEFDKIENDLYDVIKQIDGLKDNYNYYKIDNDLFKFLIELNRMYELQVRDYQLKKH